MEKTTAPLIFYTGFPGFIGSELLFRLLKARPETEAACLVQPKFAALAGRRMAELEAADASLKGRIRLLEGDITAPDLGLGGHADLKPRITEVFHLAAVYDLSVGRDFAMRINVDGTRHLLDFAESCPGLRRFQYVSTCYVSGRHPGDFSEDDLERGQRFNNFYEETKYLAEVEVRRRMAKGMPATIYRPAVVVGDSSTGATQKYDGPYLVIQWILRQPGPFSLMPMVGDPKKHCLNVVPRDFVVRSIVHLSELEGSKGRCYQLADPRPLSIEELVGEIQKVTGKRLIRIPLPLEFAKFAIDHFPGVYRAMRIPSSAINYFVQPTRYSTANADRDLKDTGIHAPSIASYLPKLVSFVRENPEIGSEAMV